MINLEDLNDQSVIEILTEAKEKISYFNPKWTYKGESDPGITIIELIVWLISIQREYLSNVSPIIGIKLLKLLGIDFKKNSGSKTLIEVSNFSPNTPYINIPKGTKFLADNLIFENKEQNYITNSQILSIKFVNCDSITEESYYEFDGSKQFYIFGKNINDNVEADENLNKFYINFDKKIPKDKEINIYFEVFLEKGLIRNPVNEEDNFEQIAHTKWEYYGIKDSCLKWHTINVKDLTYSFLFSNIVSFRIDGQMIPYDDSGYYSLRISLIKSEYDFPPQISKIVLNVFEVEQRDTHVEKIIFTKKQVLKNIINNVCNINIKTHLSLYGHTIIFIKTISGKWQNIKENMYVRDLDKGKVKIKIDNIEFLKYLKDFDDAFMLISYSDEIKDKMIIGSGLGCSGQMFEVRYKSVPIFDDFELLVGQEEKNKTVFEVWKRTSDFFSLNKNDKNFIFEENINNIIFGDNIHGMAPKNCKNSIRICSLAFTNEELSNIKKNTIKSVISENQFLKNARINQLTHATGGRSSESIAHAKKRGLKIFSEKKRAVTIKDYEKIIAQTPGLIFKNISIIPGFINSKDPLNSKSISIAVRCPNRDIIPRSYKSNILHKIEQYRLLNTSVEVIDPEYIRVNISAKVYVNSKFKSHTQIIENKIIFFLDTINKKMGQILNFVDLFGLLEKVEFVEFLEYLKITPDAHHINLVNEAGNIIPPPNGVYIFNKSDINCVMFAK